MTHLTLRSSRIRPWIALLLIGSTLSGCVTTRIVTIPNSCNTPDNDPTTQKVVTAKFWGFIQPTDLVPPCASSAGGGFNHLNGVTVWTTADQVLLSIVTLGIITKRHVRWCCAPFIPPPDEPSKP